MNEVIRVNGQGGASEIPRAIPGAIPGAGVPRPRVDEDVRIRPGVVSDYDFIDDLQKRHKHGVGFMWEAAIRGHLQKGNVLVAEAVPQGSAAGRADGGMSPDHREADGSASRPSHPRRIAPVPVGYVLGVDRYLKRDELGIIYQMNVEPAYQRSLVAANLLQAKFEASAYGCRLYCCWRAQDLPANYFWESMGFVPLALRTGGGRGKTKKDGKFRGRMHIFWQKQIREGDNGDPASGGTPYWFPGMTGSGAIGEDRLVLPIPPGTHWSDAKPIVLPQCPRKDREVDETKLLEDKVAGLQREKKALRRGAEQVTQKPKPKLVKSVSAGGLRFGPLPAAPDGDGAASDAEATKRRTKEKTAAIDAELKAAKKAARKAKKKFDPVQVAFARELKDRWLEQVQARPELLTLAEGTQKYDVRRTLPAPQGVPDGLRHLGSGGAGDEPGRLEAA